jgi:acetyl-CoA carboxylase carboxyltransferase component
VVPIVVIVTGPAVSGPALLLGLADVVIMTPDAYAFVSGPRMVTEFTGVPITPSELGGTGPHSRSSGVVSLVAADAQDARDLAAAVLSLLPTHTDELPPRLGTDDPPDRPTPELAEVVPASATGSYDVRTVARSIVDDGDLLELRATWASNIVTALGTIEGHPVGIVANQPQTLAGTLDIAASQKGARFVAWCDAFSVPLLTMVDTPGFSPGKDQEWRGMIRHGAQLAFAYARATVPRVCLTLRKSYGGAYIVMDCKTMGNDLSLAWPSAEIAVMGAKGAAEILHRRATPEERAAAEADYEERLLNPWRAAERGLIDAVIDPVDTRREVAAAFQVLRSKREQLRPRAHDNTPL